MTSGAMLRERRNDVRCTERRSKIRIRLGHLLSVCSRLGGELLPSHGHGHPKVTDLGSVSAIQQDVGKLQVTMNYITRMEVGHSLNNVQCDREIFISSSAVRNQRQQGSSLVVLVCKTETTECEMREIVTGE